MLLFPPKIVQEEKTYSVNPTEYRRALVHWTKISETSTYIKRTLL